MNFHTISVSVEELQTHINHGDKLGACDDFCPELCSAVRKEPCTTFSHCTEIGCQPQETVCEGQEMCASALDKCIPSDLNGDGNTDEKDLIFVLRSIPTLQARCHLVQISWQTSTRMDLSTSRMQT